MLAVDGRHVRKPQQGLHRRQMELSMNNVRNKIEAGEFVRNGNALRSDFIRHGPSLRTIHRHLMPLPCKFTSQITHHDLGASIGSQIRIGNKDLQESKLRRKAAHAP